jgi:hypothetical protein
MRIELNGIDITEHVKEISSAMYVPLEQAERTIRRAYDSFQRFGGPIDTVAEFRRPSPGSRARGRSRATRDQAEGRASVLLRRQAPVADRARLRSL